jgi:ribosomal protein S18 acetylase RimI-like enzyme
VQIRVLEPADWEAYRAIRLEALANAPEAFAADLEEQRRLAPEDWANRLRGADSFVLGAFENDRIVGMVGFVRQRGPKLRHKGTVWGMYVSPGCRGKGAGRLLMQELIERARRLDGLEQLTLTVVSDNAPARQLYLSLGFQVYGREPRALKVGERYLDEELMILLLPSHAD